MNTSSSFTMAEIETAAYQLSKTRDELSDIVTELQDQIRQLQRRRAAHIKRLVDQLAKLHDGLHSMIDASRPMFDKPRSYVFHGIKCGLKKGRGGIDFDDADHVVELIKKKLPEQADVLIRRTEEPNVKALEELSADDLKRIGCTITSTGDVVVIKPVDGLVEKFITALLKDLSLEAEPAEFARHD